MQSPVAQCLTAVREDVGSNLGREIIILTLTINAEVAEGMEAIEAVEAAQVIVGKGMKLLLRPKK